MNQLLDRFERLKITWFDVSAVIAISMILAFIRVREQLPQLYPDEFLYVSAIRGDNNGELPNYFYTMLYKPTALCGNAFYECTRGLNVLFFGVLLVLTFLIARKLVLLPYALLFVAFIGLGPLSGFTTLLTPEMLFFVLTFAVIAMFLYFDSATLSFWLIQALLNSLMLLTKPHGVFVTLGLVGYLVYLGIRSKRFRFYSLRATSFFVGTYALVVLIRFGLSGNFGLNPLGARYSGAVIRSGETLAGTPSTLDSSYFEPLNLLWSFVQQLVSHTSIGLAMVSVGLLFYVIHTLKTADDSAELAFVFVLGSLIVGTALFSSVSVFWNELLQIRLMPRYYEHVLLLAPIFFLRKNVFPDKWRYLAASVFIIVVLVVIQDRYIIFPFDSYFLGIWVSLKLPLAVIALPSLVIGLLLFKSKELAKLATVGSLLLLIILFNFHYQLSARQFSATPQVVLDTYELRDFLSNASDKTLFLASDQNDYNRVKFWIPDGSTTFMNDKLLTEEDLATYSQEYDVIVILESTEIESGIDATPMNASFSLIVTS